VREALDRETRGKIQFVATVFVIGDLHRSAKHEQMTFKDDLAAGLDTLPSEALERVLRAEHHDEGQLAEELTDPLNANTDFLSEEYILAQTPDACASLSSSSGAQQAPPRLKNSVSCSRLVKKASPDDDASFQ
jgi:hypothetical protein